jgi:hypothetical protein
LSTKPAAAPVGVDKSDLVAWLVSPGLPKFAQAAGSRRRQVRAIRPQCPKDAAGKAKLVSKTGAIGSGALTGGFLRLLHGLLSLIPDGSRFGKRVDSGSTRRQETKLAGKKKDKKGKKGK